MKLNKQENKGWDKYSIYLQVKGDNPHLSEEDALQRSNLIYKELNRLNQQSRRLDKHFYEHNLLLGDIRLLPLFMFDKLGKRSTQSQKKKTNC